jgi:hypothetical protein
MVESSWEIAVVVVGVGATALEPIEPANVDIGVGSASPEALQALQASDRNTDTSAAALN